MNLKDFFERMGAGQSAQIAKQIYQIPKSPKSSSSSYMTRPKTAISNKCKVPKCSQQHDQHFCRNCKSIDSDHRAKDCPNAPKNQNTNNETKQAACKVEKCSSKHAKHFCKVCENQDSDHFARDCPDGIILYHGTKLEYALKIIKEGFKPTKGRQGDVAVYLTDDFEIAAKCGQRTKHNNSTDGKYAVIECIFKGDSENLERRVHPTWAKDKISDSPFNEFLVKPEHLNRLKIFQITELTH